MGEVPEFGLAPVMNKKKSPAPAGNKNWRRDWKSSKSGKLELGGNEDKIAPLRILWGIGKDAWFPTVCGLGIQGNFIEISVDRASAAGGHKDFTNS